MYNLRYYKYISTHMTTGWTYLPDFNNFKSDKVIYIYD